MLNFLDFLADSEKSCIGKMTEKGNIFEEIVFEINFEGDLSFPELIEAFSLYFD